MQNQVFFCDSSIYSANDIAIIGVSSYLQDSSNIEIFHKNMRGSGKDTAYNKATFDSLFFNISPAEAEHLCLRQKLALQLAYEVLDNAAYTKDSLADYTVGVFVGSTSAQTHHVHSDISTYSLIGNSNAILSNRLSYFLNFNGPSLTVDALLCSGFSALNLATESIVSGECDYALVGSVGEEGIFFLLKSASKALIDRDNIWGIIRGVVNNYIPLDANIEIHLRAIQKILHASRIQPSDIEYIETYNTQNDSNHVKALLSTFNQNVPINYVNNLLELDLVAILKFLIDQDTSFQNDSLFYDGNINKLHLAEDNRKKRALIQIHDEEGNEGYIIIEAANPSKKSEDLFIPPRSIITLSARTDQSLKVVINRFKDYFQNNSDVSLHDVIYTLNIGRQHYENRVAFCYDSKQELLEALHNLDTQSYSAIFHGVSKIFKQPKIIYMFTGQGTQYLGMARELYSTFPMFRENLKKCQMILNDNMEIPLLELLFNEENENYLCQTQYAQIAIFSVQYALCQLLMHWGIKASALVGHSLGEYVAATIADALTVEDALLLVHYRSKLMQALPNGDMLAVSVSEEIISPLLTNSSVEIAAINSKKALTLTGTKEAIAAFKIKLEQQKIPFQQLFVSHAFHSQMMEPMLYQFRHYLNSVQFKPLVLPIFSNLTGELLPVGYEYTPEYWCSHIRNTVLFRECLKNITLNNYDIAIEVGPQPILSKFVKQNLGDKLPVISTLQCGASDQNNLNKLLASLYVRGTVINWSRIFEDETRYRLPLPSYPFRDNENECI